MSQPSPAAPAGQAPYVRILGRTVALGHATPTPVRSPLQARLLATLVIAGPSGLTPEQAEDAVWPADPPRTARQSLHNLLHRLRAMLGEDAVAWDGTRYTLRVATDLRDLLVAAETARSALAGRAVLAVLDAVQGVDLSTDTPPLVDLGDLPGLARVRRQVAAARDDLSRASLAALRQSGRTEDAERWLEARLAADPAREDLWVQLMEVLEQSGRRSDALTAYHRARQHLRERQGLEPGPALQQAQRRLLLGRRAREEDADGPVVLDRALVARLAAALAEGAVVLVSGEAGVGKSTLLGAVATSWTAGPCHLVACEDNPWTALGPAQDLLDRLGVTHASAAGRPTRVTRAVQQGVAREDAVRAIGRALGEVPGALVVLDDVDLAGPTTAAILVDGLRGAGCGVLLAARDRARAADRWAPAVDHVLDGLDGPAVADVVAGMTGRPTAEVVHARWVHELTGGHPMLVREVVRILDERDPGWVAQAEPPELGEVGPRLRTLLGERLDDLPSSTRRAVDVVAVMGLTADPAVLAWLTDPARLEPAVAAGILRRDPSGTVRFAHDLLRRVAYEEVPEGRRRELHHAVGQRLADVEGRAAHLLEAADLDPAAAIAAAAAAGEVALGRQAYAEAGSRFRQAADLAEGRGEARQVTQLRLEAADADRLAGRPGHADALLAAAEAALAHDHADLRRRATLAALALGEVVDRGPAQERAMALAARALEAEHDVGWQARIMATSSLLYSITDQHERCRELFLGAQDRMPAGDAQVACDALPYAYMSLSHVGDLARREAAAAALAEAAEVADDDIARFEAGHLAVSCALVRGDGPAARAAHARMVGLADTVGDAGRRWSLAYQQAALTVLDGDLEAAEAANQRAFEIGQGVAPARALAAFSGQLFEIRRLQGRLAELAPVLDHLVTDQPEIAGWQAAAALAHVEADPDRARALLDGLVATGLAGLPRDFAWLAGVMSLGRTAAALRAPEAARVLLGHLTPHEDLVCWQGTCTYGPAAEVMADLVEVIGEDPAPLRDRAAGLRAGLAAG